jgi:molecular chaperone GrpE
MMKKITVKKNTEIDIVKSQLTRALADYDNLRKRVEREKELFEKQANIKLAIKLLPVLDVLKSAQGHLKDRGIEMTIKEFEEALTSEGIEEINVKIGDEFNPETMEVTEVVEDGDGKGKIVDVVSSGWRFKEGFVVRYARVKVSKKGNIK